MGDEATPSTPTYHVMAWWWWCGRLLLHTKCVVVVVTSYFFLIVVHCRCYCYCSDGSIINCHHCHPSAAVASLFVYCSLSVVYIVMYYFYVYACLYGMHVFMQGTGFVFTGSGDEVWFFDVVFGRVGWDVPVLWREGGG